MASVSPALPERRVGRRFRRPFWRVGAEHGPVSMPCRTGSALVQRQCRPVHTEIFRLSPVVMSSETGSQAYRVLRLLQYSQDEAPCEQHFQNEFVFS